jgi:hypothetical protein
MLLLPDKLDNYAIYRIDDSNLAGAGAVPIRISDNSMFNSKPIYAFYSSCTEKPERFSFIYKEGNNYQIDSERIISDIGC